MTSGSLACTSSASCQRPRESANGGAVEPTLFGTFWTSWVDSRPVVSARSPRSRESTSRLETSCSASKPVKNEKVRESVVSKIRVFEWYQNQGLLKKNLSEDPGLNSRRGDGDDAAQMFESDAEQQVPDLLRAAVWVQLTPVNSYCGQGHQLTRQPEPWESLETKNCRFSGVAPEAFGSERRVFSWKWLLGENKLLGQLSTHISTHTSWIVVENGNIIPLVADDEIPGGSVHHALGRQQVDACRRRLPVLHFRRGEHQVRSVGRFARHHHGVVVGTHQEGQTPGADPLSHCKSGIATHSLTPSFVTTCQHGQQMFLDNTRLVEQKRHTTINCTIREVETIFEELQGNFEISWGNLEFLVLQVGLHLLPSGLDQS